MATAAYALEGGNSMHASWLSRARYAPPRVHRMRQHLAVKAQHNSVCASGHSGAGAVGRPTLPTARARMLRPPTYLQQAALGAPASSTTRAFRAAPTAPRPAAQRAWRAAAYARRASRLTRHARCAFPRRAPPAPATTTQPMHVSPALATRPAPVAAWSRRRVAHARRALSQTPIALSVWHQVSDS